MYRHWQTLSSKDKPNPLPKSRKKKRCSQFRQIPGVTAGPTLSHYQIYADGGDVTTVHSAVHWNSGQAVTAFYENDNNVLDDTSAAGHITSVLLHGRAT